MPFSRSAHSVRPAFGDFLAPQPSHADIASLLASPKGYAAYSGVGSRETPQHILWLMVSIAEALEARGFTLRSGFAGGADTAFELGTSIEDQREIFAPWSGFGADPSSKWDKPRWDLIRAWEARTGRRFVPAKARLLSGALAAKAEGLAAQHHPAWNRLKPSAQKLHSRNMGQVLGTDLETPARFLIAWTKDGQATGGTGQAIRIAQSLGIPVLNLHSDADRAEIIRVLDIDVKAHQVAAVRLEAATPPPAGTGLAGVRYCSGDVTTDDADLLVNTVNCVGVMGKGVALAFKTRWPAIMPAYKKACSSRELQPGGCKLFVLPDGRLWAGLATKDHWRDPSQLDWIRTGLRQLAQQARAAGIRSIALPPPGCGLGGLAWSTVEPIVLAELGEFDLRLYAQPSGAR